MCLSRGRAGGVENWRCRQVPVSFGGTEYVPQGCKNTPQSLAKASRGVANQPEPPDVRNGFRGATKHDIFGNSPGMLQPRFLV